MSHETKKANLRRRNDPLFKKVFSGAGIDIGCGDDPLMVNGQFPQLMSIKRFDVEDGNAQNISLYEDSKYDFVYSSHCLEHLLDPGKALFQWAALVKDAGYLIIVVPDEDLYEQGVFPSRFNKQHRFTFTINKYQSWSPASINMSDLIAKLLPTWKVLKMKVEDVDYDYSRMGSGVDQTAEGAEANIEVVLQK